MLTGTLNKNLNRGNQSLWAP